MAERDLREPESDLSHSEKIGKDKNEDKNKDKDKDKKPKPPPIIIPPKPSYGGT